MSASFSLLSDKLLRAFDAETGGTRTKTEKVLDQRALARQTEDMTLAVQAAQKGLDEALLTNDPEAIAEASRNLFRAQEDIENAALQRQADRERQAYEDQREGQRLRSRVR
jgi:hypothetical protein